MQNQKNQKLEFVQDVISSPARGKEDSKVRMGRLSDWGESGRWNETAFSEPGRSPGSAVSLFLVT